MKKIYLIDTENTGNRWMSVLEMADRKDKIYVFYTGNSAHQLSSFQNSDYSERKIYWRQCEAGNNALDFQLSTELGYLVHTIFSYEYIIISNDKGYESVIHYWVQQGKNVRRVNCDQLMKMMNKSENDIVTKNVAKSEKSDTVIQSKKEKINLKSQSEKNREKKAEDKKKTAAKKSVTKKKQVEKPAKKKPNEKKKTAEKLVDKKPNEKKKTAEKLVDKKPNEKEKIAEKLVDKKPNEKEKTAEKLVDKKSNEKKKTAEKLVDKKPNEKKKTAEKLVDKKPNEKEKTAEKMEKKQTEKPVLSERLIRQLFRSLSVQQLQMINNTLVAVYGSEEAGKYYQSIKKDRALMKEVESFYLRDSHARAVNYISALLEYNNLNICYAETINKIVLKYPTDRNKMQAEICSAIPQKGMEYYNAVKKLANIIVKVNV